MIDNNDPADNDFKELLRRCMRLKLISVDEAHKIAARYIKSKQASELRIGEINE